MLACSQIRSWIKRLGRFPRKTSWIRLNWPKRNRDAGFPLGWTLSHDAISEMDYQLLSTFNRATNMDTIAKIVRMVAPFPRKSH